MNVLELFAGIGGMGLGLERAGATIVGACEIDEAARGVYADHWPDVPLFPDVTELTPDDLGTTRIDLIAAGFPCQDLSVAGRRAGLGGARSGLFWHIVRLAAATRPRWIVLENVPGLLSAVCPCPGDGTCGDEQCAADGGDPHPVGWPGGACVGGCMAVHGGAMGTVLGALGDLGYGWAYRVLDAQHFGVPQRRRRVFIVGCLGDRAAPVEVLLEPEGGSRDLAPSRAPGARVAATLTSGSDRSGRAGRRTEDDVDLIVGALLANTGDRHVNDAEANRLVVSTKAGHNTMPSVSTATAVRRLTPTECERLQGFPDGWTATSNGKPQSDSTRYRQLGNAVAVPVVEWIARRLRAKGLVPSTR